MVFDSSQIPGEIIDLMVVNTATLKDNPALGKALVGAWYETMALMAADDAAGKAARDGDGQGLGHRPGRLRQPARHHQDVLHAGRGGRLRHAARRCPRPWSTVRQFSFDHGLLGEGAKSADAVGIALPGRQGRWATPANVKLRFDADVHAAWRRTASSEAGAATGSRAMTRLINRHPSRGAAPGAGRAAVRLLLALPT